MLILCQVIVGVALFTLAYTWVGYPLAVLLFSRLKPYLQASESEKTPLSFSVIIAVSNESAQIASKIQSVLAMNDAGAIKEVFVGLDGSDEQTVGVTKRMSDPRILVRLFDRQRGKPSVLNDLVAQATGDILLFTDARQHFEPHALSRLKSRFRDPSVGVVSGELMFLTDKSNSATGQGMDAYWLYEKWIRNNEGRFGSVPGATGAIYAVRRPLFRPIPPGCLLDDVYVPMCAIMAGSRCVFEAGAIAYDTPSQDDQAELIRKRRTLSGNLQLVRMMPGILNPWKNPIWWQFVSHKLLRLLSPFALACALLANIPLRHHPAFRVTLVAQAAFYLVAIIAQFARRVDVAMPGWTSVPLLFLSLQKSILLAWMDFFTGKHQVVWARSR